MPDPETVSHPHLRALLDDALAVRAEAERLRDTFSDAQLAWKSAPGVWSIAECFEHLRKMSAAYAPRIAESIERAEASARPFRPSLIGRTMIYVSSPESSLKMKSPGPTRPQTASAGALDRFLDQQAALLDLLRRADGRDLRGGRFGSPLLGIVRLTLGDGLTLLVRHEERHLGQALRVSRQPDFPRR